LFGGDSDFSADGRADIDSKRAPNESRHAQFSQALQLVIDKMAPHLGLLHLRVSPKDLAVMRGDLKGHDETAEAALGLPIDKSDVEAIEQSTLVRWSAGNAGHECSSYSNLIHLRTMADARQKEIKINSPGATRICTARLEL
jgi:hypothetical protein